MPKFQYQARDKKGQLLSGEVEAIEERGAADLLQSQGYAIISLTPERSESLLDQATTIFRRINQKEIVFFSRQLSVLIDANVPIVQAIETLTKQSENERFQQVLIDVGSEVEGGASLSAALSRHPNVFSELYISLVKAGEVSGNLREVLGYLANQLERDYETRSRVIGAFYYPGFIFAALIVMVIIVFVFVFPQLTELIKQTAVVLPWSTRILIWLTGFLQHFWWLVIVLILFAIVLVRLYIHSDTGRPVYDRLKLRLPLFGKLAREVYLARFARNLATLLRGEIPIIKAMDTVSTVIGNTVYRDIVLEMAHKVETGSPMADVLVNRPEIPSAVVQMVNIGERTGKLDELLTKLADFYEREIDRTLKTLTSFIEPALIVVIGLGVAFVIFSVILPIYQVTLSF